MEITRIWISKIRFFTHQGLAYGHKVINVFVQAIFLLIIAMIANTAILYLGKMLWFTYTSTPLGQIFIKSYQFETELMSDIFDRDIFSFSLEITITAFAICLCIGIACKIFYILRFLYEPKGYFGRIIFFGLPIAAVIMIRIRDVYEFSHWFSAYILSLIPILLVLSGCFLFASELFPEVGDIPDLIRGKGE